MENSTYELELVPIKTGNFSIELWTVKRWKEVIEADNKNEEAYIQNFPLWIKIWEASIVLSEYLSSADMVKGASILELGAGMGLTGMVLGAMGNSVTLTDYNDHSLALLKRNAVHNKLQNIMIKKLDWLNPGTNKTYDIILGTELIYKEEFIDPVLDLLKRFLKPDGTVFIAHDLNRSTMVEFITRADNNFQIQSMIKKMRSEKITHRIAIHTLRFR